MIINFKIEGDPPNKQGDKTKPHLKEKLIEVQKNELKSEPIRSAVKISIFLYNNSKRYIREGQDNIYIGDLDNVINGICDNLKKIIIHDDQQINEIYAKRCVDETLKEGYYEIKIEDVLD